MCSSATRRACSSLPPFARSDVRGSTDAVAVERAHSSRRPASVPSQSGVLLNGSSAGLKFSAAPGILACTSARRPHLSSRSSKESAAPRHSASRRACSGLGFGLGFGLGLGLGLR